MSRSSDDGRNGRPDAPGEADGVLGRLSGERPRRLGRERPAGRASGAPRRAAATTAAPPTAVPPEPPGIVRPDEPEAAGPPPTTELLVAAVETAGELARITLTLYGRLLRGALGLSRGSRRSDS